MASISPYTNPVASNQGTTANTGLNPPSLRDRCRAVITPLLENMSLLIGKERLNANGINYLTSFAELYDLELVKIQDLLESLVQADPDLDGVPIERLLEALNNANGTNYMKLFQGKS